MIDIAATCFGRNVERVSTSDYILHPNSARHSLAHRPARVVITGS